MSYIQSLSFIVFILNSFIVMFFYLFSMAKVVLFAGGMCIIFEAECKIGTKKVSNSDELDTLWG